MTKPMGTRGMKKHEQKSYHYRKRGPWHDSTTAENCFKKGDIRKAIEYLKTSLKHDSTNAMTHLYLSEAYLLMERLGKALSHCNKALAYGCNSSYIYITMAAIYQAKEETLEAENILQEGMNIFPQRSYFPHSIFRLLDDGADNNSEAQHYLETAIECEPNNLGYWKEYALLLLGSSDMANLPKLLECGKKLVSLEPRNYKGYYVQALAAYGLNQLDQAWQYFEKAASLKNDTAMLSKIPLLKKQINRQKTVTA